MARRKGIWGDIDELLEQGEHPVVAFPKGNKVIVPKKPRGRPRLYPEGMSPHRTWVMQTSSGRAMRCRNKGCQKFVPKNSLAIVCSGACAEELARYCKSTLDVLEGRVSAKDYPTYYRSTHLTRRKKVA